MVHINYTYRMPSVYLQLTTEILLNKLTELTLFLIIYLTKLTMVHINYTYRMPPVFHHLSTTKNGPLSWVGFGRV